VDCKDTTTFKKSKYRFSQIHICQSFFHFFEWKNCSFCKYRNHFWIIKIVIPAVASFGARGLGRLSAPCASRRPPRAPVFPSRQTLLYNNNVVSKILRSSLRLLSEIFEPLNPRPRRNVGGNWPDFQPFPFSLPPLRPPKVPNRP